MNKKDKLIAMIYIVFLIICMIVRVDFIQSMNAIIVNIILIFLLYNRLKINDSKLKLISICILIFNIILVYFNYYNSINLGFNDGLVYGKLGDFNYTDTKDYYDEGKYLCELWQNGYFKSWINGDIDRGTAFYGYYNFFVVFNAIFHYIFGSNINVFIIIKLQFSVVSIYLLYEVSKKFLSKQYSRIVVILTNIFPGYFLVNITLMRDNIILFLILYLFYLVVEIKDHNRKNMYLYYIKMMSILAIITYARSYVGITFAIAILIYYMLINYKVWINPKFISKCILVLIVVCVVINVVSQSLGYGYFGNNVDLAKYSDDNRWDADKVNSPLKLILWTVYILFTGGKIKLSYLQLYIGNFLNGFSSIYIFLFVLPVLLIFLFKIVDMNVKSFIVFSFTFSILCGGLICYVYTGIVPRLYVSWIWSQIIILCYLMEKFRKFKSVILIQYLIYGAVYWMLLIY